MRMTSNSSACPRSLEATVKRIRHDFPGLIFENERLDMAFKIGRDDFLLTSHRIMMLDTKGKTGRKVKFRSIPYRNIECILCETQGNRCISVLKVFCGHSDSDLTIEFDAFGVDIYNVQAYLGPFIFGDPNPSFSDPPAFPPAASFVEGRDQVVSVLLNDLCHKSVDVFQQNLQAIGLLIDGEIVDLVVKTEKHVIFFTNRRLIYVFILNHKNQHLEYLAMRYSSIKLYDLESVRRSVDEDTRLRIWTNIGFEYNCIASTLKREKCNIKEVMYYLNRKLMRDTVSRTPESAPRVTSGDKVPSHLWWMKKDVGELDVKVTSDHFRRVMPILEENEWVELGYKGYTDLVILTNKRIVFIDVKRLTTKRINCVTIPYASVKIVEVSNSCSGSDADGEVSFYTEVWYAGSTIDDRGPPKKERSCMSFEYRRKTTDMVSFIKYMSIKLYQSDTTYNAANVDMTSKYKMNSKLTLCKPDAMEFLFDYFTDTDAITSTKAVGQILGPNGAAPILNEGELVLMAYKREQSCFIFTSINMVEVYKDHFDPKIIKFRLMPYSLIRSYSVSTSGREDHTCTIKFNTQTPWKPQISRTFTTAPQDVISIQALIAARVLGPPDQPSDFAYDTTLKSSNPVEMEVAIDYLIDNPSSVDLLEIEAHLKSEVSIFQVDEIIDYALHHGRELFILSNKRICVIDLQSISHRKLEFRTYPLKYINHFEISSQGHMRRSVRGAIFNGCLDGSPYAGPNGVYRHEGRVAITKKSEDLFVMGNSFSEKILRSQFNEVA